MTPTETPRKVGDDCQIFCTFRDEHSGALLDLSWATISIRNKDGTNIVNDQTAEIESTGVASFRYRHTAAGQYTIEWVGVHAGGVLRSPTIEWRIEEKVGTSLDPVGTDPDVPPVISWLGLPGVTYEVPSGSAVRDLVGTPDATTATSYASRGLDAEDDEDDVAPLAAAGVIVAKLSDTTARLAKVAILDGFSALTPNAPMYLGLDGQWSHAPTTTNGEIDQHVGWAISETRAVISLLAPPRVVQSRVEVDYAATLSLDADTDYDMSDVLTGDLAVTVADAVEDMSGSLGLKQGAGSNTFSLACTGATVIHRGTDIASGAGKSSLVFWEVRRIAGVLQCWWDAVPEP